MARETLQWNDSDTKDEIYNTAVSLPLILLQTDRLYCSFSFIRQTVLSAVEDNVQSVLTREFDC